MLIQILIYSFYSIIKAIYLMTITIFSIKYSHCHFYYYFIQILSFNRVLSCLFVGAIKTMSLFAIFSFAIDHFLEIMFAPKYKEQYVFFYYKFYQYNQAFQQKIQESNKDNLKHQS